MDNFKKMDSAWNPRYEQAPIMGDARAFKGCWLVLELGFRRAAQPGAV
jgi:hypothetical protein